MSDGGAPPLFDEEEITVTVVDPCPTDVNGDGSVDVLDLIDLLLAFGTACP